MMMMMIVDHFDVQVGFSMVDELCDLKPKQEKDSFFDVVDVDIAYNESTIEYRDRRYTGSAVEKAEYVCCGLWSVLHAGT